MTIKRPRKKPARQPTPINDKMERFCQEYIKSPIIKLMLQSLLDMLLAVLASAHHS